MEMCIVCEDSVSAKIMHFLNTCKQNTKKNVTVKSN